MSKPVVISCAGLPQPTANQVHENNLLAYKLLRELPPEMLSRGGRDLILEYVTMGTQLVHVVKTGLREFERGQADVWTVTIATDPLPRGVTFEEANLILTTLARGVLKEVIEWNNPLSYVHLRARETNLQVGVDGQSLSFILYDLRCAHFLNLQPQG